MNYCTWILHYFNFANIQWDISSVLKPNVSPLHGTTFLSTSSLNTVANQDVIGHFRYMALVLVQQHLTVLYITGRVCIKF